MDRFRFFEFLSSFKISYEIMAFVYKLAVAQVVNKAKSNGWPLTNGNPDDEDDDDDDDDDDDEDSSSCCTTTHLSKVAKRYTKNIL